VPADRTIPVAAEPGDIFFADGGRHLVVPCRDSHIRTFETATGKLLQDIERKGATVVASNRFVDRGEKKEVRMWDLTAERQMQVLYNLPTGRTVLSPDGKYLAVSNTAERQVRVVDVAAASQKHALADGIGGTAEMIFSPNGELLVSANYDNDIRVWKTRSGELVSKIEDMTGAMFAGEFTPDGKHLVMAGLDEIIYIRDTQSMRVVRKIQGHGETISALAISPDGRTIVTGGFDVRTTRNPVKVVLWDFSSGNVLRKLDAPHRVVSLAFSPDSKWLAMTAGEKEIALWSVAR